MNKSNPYVFRDADHAPGPHQERLRPVFQIDLDRPAKVVPNRSKPGSGKKQHTIRPQTAGKKDGREQVPAVLAQHAGTQRSCSYIHSIHSIRSAWMLPVWIGLLFGLAWSGTGIQTQVSMPAFLPVQAADTDMEIPEGGSVSVMTDPDADGMVVNGITYEPTGSATAALSFAADAQGTVQIPSSILYKGKQYAVTAINAKAFIGCQRLEKVVLPQGLLRIRNYAFAMCTSLKEVVFPDTLTSIGKAAFSNCASLTNLQLPEGLKTIGESAFEGCSSLDAVQIPDSVESIGDFAFFNCPDLKTFIFDSKSLRLGDHLFNSEDVQIYGAGSQTPAYLSSYAGDYLGTYEGENLNTRSFGDWHYDLDSDQYIWLQPDMTQVFGDWILQNGDWYYVKEDGFRAEGWLEIDGVYYHFRNDGVMEADTWATDDGKLYYLDEGGAMMTNAWKEVDGKFCYFLSDGSIARSQLIPWKGAGYYVDKEGWMVTDASVLGCTFGPDGSSQQVSLTIPQSVVQESLAKSEERAAVKAKIQEEQRAYEAAREEAIAKNEALGEWKYLPGPKQYVWIRPDAFQAYMTWIHKDGNWYYVNGDGYRVTGWQEIDGAYYHFNPEGIMSTNTWVLDKGKYYYLTTDGSMATGTFVPFNGICYYVNATGALTTDETILGIYVDKNGRAFQAAFRIPGLEEKALAAAAAALQQEQALKQADASAAQTSSADAAASSQTGLAMSVTAQSVDPQETESLLDDAASQSIWFIHDPSSSVYRLRKLQTPAAAQDAVHDPNQSDKERTNVLNAADAEQ